MKILVTGGAGFIGSHIVDCLIEEGHAVSIVDDLSTGNIEFVNARATLHRADITRDLTGLFEREQPEIVIHAAAQTMLRESIAQPTRDASINIIGTINVLEACRKTGVKKIIYTSTGGARVGEPEYFPVDERHPIRPLSPYGISKHTAEHYVEAYGRAHDIEYLIFCFGNVYGPRDDPRNKRLIPIFSYAMVRGVQPTIFGDGNQTRDFIYVVDIARFITACIRKSPAHKLFHLGNGEEVSVNRIFSLLKEYSGFTRDAIHGEAVKGEVRDIVLDTSLAREELGWRVGHPFEVGLKATFEWYKARYQGAERTSAGS